MGTQRWEGDAGRIRIPLPKGFAEQAPAYVKRRMLDTVAITTALEEGRFDVVRLLGHRMKGTGTGYGMELVSRAGAGIEEAARRQDRAAALRWTLFLSDFLSRVKVVEVPE